MSPYASALTTMCFTSATLLLFAPGVAAAEPSSPSVVETTVHGWKALVLRNQVAEVTVVPEIGRMLQFGLRASSSKVPGGVAGTEGPFWRHPALGAGMRPDLEGWINFGGDKAWPAPQSQWPKVLGKAWPPPRTFDALPQLAMALGPKIWMESSTDPTYGVAIERVLSLDPVQPVLTSVTTYKKLSGAPVGMGVWTLTQLAAPERVFVQLAAPPQGGKGYDNLLPASPKDVQVVGKLLSMALDPAQKTLLAAEGNAMLWVGAGPSLLMEAQAPTFTGPAGQTPPAPTLRAQIYASPTEGQRYVELQFLSAVRELRPGERASLTVVYTLIPRVDPDAHREAARIFGRAPQSGPKTAARRPAVKPAPAPTPAPQ